MVQFYVKLAFFYCAYPAVAYSSEVYNKWLWAMKVSAPASLITFSWYHFFNKKICIFPPISVQQTHNCFYTIYFEYLPSTPHQFSHLFSTPNSSSKSSNDDVDLLWITWARVLFDSRASRSGSGFMAKTSSGVRIKPRCEKSTIWLIIMKKTIQNFPPLRLWGKWIQDLGAVISKIVWVDKR